MKVLVAPIDYFEKIIENRLFLFFGSQWGLMARHRTSASWKRLQSVLRGTQSLVDDHSNNWTRWAWIAIHWTQCNASPGRSLWKQTTMSTQTNLCNRWTSWKSLPTFERVKNYGWKQGQDRMDDLWQLEMWLQLISPCSVPDCNTMLSQMKPKLVLTCASLPPRIWISLRKPWGNGSLRKEALLWSLSSNSRAVKWPPSPKTTFGGSNWPKSPRKEISHWSLKSFLLRQTLAILEKPDTWLLESVPLGILLFFFMIIMSTWMRTSS